MPLVPLRIMRRLRAIHRNPTMFHLAVSCAMVISMSGNGAGKAGLHVQGEKALAKLLLGNQVG